MLSHLLLAALAACAAASAKPWRPQPPCAAPLGVDSPAVAESMCSRVLASAGDIVVREYGLPASATLASVEVISTVFYDALATGVEQLLQYFGGQNAAGRSFLGARTTPVTVRNLNDRNITYVVSMMVSTAAFPDSAAIPQPSLPVRLESVGLRSIAALQFNTTSPPVEADFDAACGRLLSGSLPRGYALDAASPWSPTYVLYSGQDAMFFTSECWAEVTAAA
jgi:hypothetical protein